MKIFLSNETRSLKTDYYSNLELTIYNMLKLKMAHIVDPKQDKMTVSLTFFFQILQCDILTDFKSRKANTLSMKGCLTSTTVWKDRLLV